MWRASVIYIFVFSLMLCNAKKSYDGYRLVSTKAQTDEQFKLLGMLEDQFPSELNFFVEPGKGREAEILVAPSLLKTLETVLLQAGMTMDVKVSNIQRKLDQESLMMSILSSGPMELSDIYSRYLSYDEIIEWLVKMDAEYPEHVKYDTAGIGTTYEERTIPWVKVVASDGSNDEKPVIIVECLTHAREWISGSACLGTMHNLVENYGKDTPEGKFASQMLDTFDWFFIPVHNPDGYAYTWTDERFWRKNRVNYTSNNSDCIGVDLNRNWGVDHGRHGTSRNPCSSVYSIEAFSERETTSVKEAAENLLKQGRKIHAFFSFHAYSQLMLLPYGFTTIVQPDNFALHLNISQKAMDALYEVDGKRFQIGRPGDILYFASGGAYDYFKVALNATFAFTYELRPSRYDSDAFALPASKIDISIKEVFTSLGVFSKEIAKYL